MANGPEIEACGHLLTANKQALRLYWMVAGLKYIWCVFCLSPVVEKDLDGRERELKAQAFSGAFN